MPSMSASALADDRVRSTPATARPYLVARAFLSRKQADQRRPGRAVPNPDLFRCRGGTGMLEATPPPD
jgi:hypothetical protein